MGGRFYGIRRDAGKLICIIYIEQMKAKHYLPMAVLALAVAAGCDSKKEAVMTSGIDLTNLDTTAVQGADFYQYACGGWMKKHPLTNEYSRFGSFDMLAENNREQLKGLIVDIAAGQNAQGTIGQKIGDIYNLAMDSVKLMMITIILRNIIFILILFLES